MRFFYFLIFPFLSVSIFANEINDKILICGIGKNVARCLDNIMHSMEACGGAFADYRIIVYENDSTDGTTWILSQWALHNPKVIFLTEKISHDKLLSVSSSGKACRTEIIAYARNQVLKAIQHPKFSDYKYVLMSDMDFLTPWNIEEIVNTIKSPIEWDAVFANGLLEDGRMYDLFAFRDVDYPIGPELTSDWWWANHGWFKIDPDSDWKPVYSAFNGLGIYKRRALLDCQYSGAITENVEKQVMKWLDQGLKDQNVFAQQYLDQLNQVENVYTLQEFKQLREKPPVNSSRILISHHPDRLYWPICKEKLCLITICEHIGLHSDMAEKGFNRLFINPKLTLRYLDY